MLDDFAGQFIDEFHSRAVRNALMNKQKTVMLRDFQFVNKTLLPPSLRVKVSLKKKKKATDNSVENIVEQAKNLVKAIQ